MTYEQFLKQLADVAWEFDWYVDEANRLRGRPRNEKHQARKLPYLRYCPVEAVAGCTGLTNAGKSIGLSPRSIDTLADYADIGPDSWMTSDYQRRQRRRLLRTVGVRDL